MKHDIGGRMLLLHVLRPEEAYNYISKYKKCLIARDDPIPGRRNKPQPLETRFPVTLCGALGSCFKVAAIHLKIEILFFTRRKNQ